MSETASSTASNEGKSETKSKDSGNKACGNKTFGVVASLYLHPEKATASKSSQKSTAMIEVKTLTFDECGIVGEPKRFRREAGHRQVTMFERESIANHASTMTKKYGTEDGPCTLKPGDVRANIETMGINLCDGVTVTEAAGARATAQERAIARAANAHIEIHFEGGVVLRVSEAREPCNKMDWLYQGLQDSMRPGSQGLCLTCICVGKVSVGEKFTIEHVDR